MDYAIKRAITRPTITGDWDSPAWRDANVLQVNSFHAQPGGHRPITEAKLLHDDDGLYVIFRVSDQFVVCTRTEHQTLTSKDSCVEAYFQPFPDKGYFNFEMNCGGALLLFYVTDSTRIPRGVFKRKAVVPRAILETMRIYHSIPKSLDREIAEPVDWTVEYLIPNALFEAYVGALDAPASRQWRGNFFKCADESSHPHWASWNPIGPELNFHVPGYFGALTFER